MRPPTPASAKKRAWKAFSEYIRARDKKCITCSSPADQAGHFLHNSDKGSNPNLGGNELWYSEKNVNGQEASCNLHKSGNGSVYAVKLIEKYGEGVISELYKLYNTPRKWTIEEVLEKEQEYIKKLEEL